jgi:hypothetical protein
VYQPINAVAEAVADILHWAGVLTVHCGTHQQSGEQLVAKGDEKAFENKVKASRFLVAVMGILCRHYGTCASSCIAA